MTNVMENEASQRGGDRQSVFCHRGRVRPHVRRAVLLAALAVAGALMFGATSALGATCAHPEVSDVQSIGERSGILHGSVNPEGMTTEWRFEISESASGGWQPVGAFQTLPYADSELHPVSAEATGLKPDTSYYWRLSARNTTPCAVTAPQAVFQKYSIFETAGPPTVTTFAVHSFGAGSEDVRVLAAVYPHGFDTHYHFVFGKDQAYGGGTEEVDAGTRGDQAQYPFSAEAVLVGANLTGVEPGATYHFAVVATNTAAGNPVVVGNDETVTIPVPAKAITESCPNEALRVGPSAYLPDCRAYEQVTPMEKEGAQDMFTYSNSNSNVMVGEDGDHVAVTGVAEWGTTVNSTGRTTYSFTRTTSNWGMTSLTPAGAADNSYEAQLFSPNLEQYALSVGWASSGFNFSEVLEFMAGPPGGPYTIKIGPVPRSQHTFWVAQSADHSKLILQSEDHQLTGPTGTTSGYDLYEWSGGSGLRQVNAGIGTCGAKMVSGYEMSRRNLEEGILFHGGGAAKEDTVASPHDVSSDGSRVFFEAVPGNNCSEPSHLYISEDGTDTEDLGAYAFGAANVEGSELLLIKKSGENAEFVLYKVKSKTSEPLLTVEGAIGGGGVVENLIVDEDLTAFYLRSAAKLTAEAPWQDSLDKIAGVSQGFNFYRYDIPRKELSYVAQVARDSGVGAGGYYTSPDGRFLYINSPEVGGVPGGGRGDEQTYRYDSARNTIECLSCASSFKPAPPLMSFYIPEHERSPEEVVNETPQATVSSPNGDYVFFVADSELVPHDVNGEVGPESDSEHSSVSFSTSSDVYEWRANDIGGCTHVQGCLALITTGAADGLRTPLFGVADEGRDVFFATHSQLVGQDRDNAGDLYDARIGGGFPPPAAEPAECSADACLHPASAPLDSTPSSVSFSGPGNPVPTVSVKVGRKAKPGCAKGKVRRSRRCVKKRKRRKPRGRARRVVRRAAVRNRGGHR